mmetsp:Transcript_10364/g.21337  ORF Transcript_10364/g.21337 Transcript_10364/m.21337 type:complete len:101 (+) Transcript_10364:2620-2922(+)
MTPSPISLEVLSLMETMWGLQVVSEGVRGTQVTPEFKVPQQRMLENQCRQRTEEFKRGPGNELRREMGEVGVDSSCERREAEEEAEGESVKFITLVSPFS